MRISAPLALLFMLLCTIAFTQTYSQYTVNPACCVTADTAKPVAAVHFCTVKVKLLLGKRYLAHMLTAADAVTIAAATELVLPPFSRARSPLERAVLVVIPTSTAHCLEETPAVWYLQQMNTPISNGLLVSQSIYMFEAALCRLPWVYCSAGPAEISACARHKAISLSSVICPAPTLKQPPPGIPIASLTLGIGSTYGDLPKTFTSADQNYIPKSCQGSAHRI